MKEVRASSPLLEGMVAYDPKYLAADVLLSANESPVNVPDEVLAAVRERIGELDFNRYPDPLANRLRSQIADVYGLKTANVLLGNGGDELLFDLFAAWGGQGRSVLNFPPTFSVYQTDAELTGTRVVNLPRAGGDYHIDVDRAVAYLQGNETDIVVVTSPNNPTGMCTDVADLRRILDASDALVLVDEAYGEFAGGGRSALPLLGEYGNLVILHTFSKAYRLAGVRLGYLLAHASVLDELKKVRQPYSVDAISQIVGEEVLAHRELFADSIEQTRRQRDWLVEQLAGIEDVEVHPTQANFVLFHVPDVTHTWKALHEKHSVLVRNVSGDPRLPGRLRVTVGTPEENERFVSALVDVLADYRAGR